MSAVLNHGDTAADGENALGGSTPHSVPESASMSVVKATEQLMMSRQRLQLALTETAHANRPSSAVLRREQMRAEKHPSPEWMNELKNIPGVGLGLQALSAWWATRWQQHPLNRAVSMAWDAANAVAKPMAQRNPIPMALAAVAVGAVLAYSRPWRWILKPALFAGLLAKVSAKLVSEVPLQSWMSLVTAALHGRTQGASAPPAPHPQTNQQTNPQTNPQGAAQR